MKQISGRGKIRAVAQQHVARMAEFRYQVRRFLHFSETVSESSGISAQQYQLLQVVSVLSMESSVSESPASLAEPSASISRIAERMLLRHNSAVELVDRAERLGLVARVADADDQRRSLVVLTEHGRGVLEQLAAAHFTELATAGPLIVASLERLLTSGKAGAGAGKGTSWR